MYREPKALPNAASAAISLREHLEARPMKQIMREGSTQSIINETYALIRDNPEVQIRNLF